MAGSWFAQIKWADIDPPPDVFAVVMATGIVSIAAGDHHYRWISVVLAALAVAAFLALGIGFLIRVATRPDRVIRLTRDPDVALRMFTFVAACGVLGTRWRQHLWAVALLGGLSLAGWLVLAPLGAVDVASRPRSELQEHAHGAWLLPSVATAGLAISVADLAFHTGRSWLVVAAAGAWVVAIGLYAAVVWLIAWRALAAPFVPGVVTPDAWILMGALAISTLAGASILRAANHIGSPAGLIDVAKPLTMAAWILASLWIPVLTYAELWRADHLTGSLRYEGVWWSAVFPLGMYATATAATSSQLHIRGLLTVSLVFFWVSVAVWVTVSAGLLHIAAVRRSGRSPENPTRKID